MSEPTDADLVSSTRSGDRDAYSILVARYQGHVYGLAYSLVDNWADAQDIAQETFIRAYVHLDQLHDPARFPAWLRRVTFSVAMNWLGSFRPDLFKHLEGRVDLDSLEIPDFRPGPSEVVEKRELADAVRTAIAALPAKYRLPLTMFHLDGLSYRKVADFLDIPLGSVKVLLHRARRKLKALLPAYLTEEVTPMVQEVFDEHKLPPEFSREVWSLCMDWLCSGDVDSVAESTANRKDYAERVVLAAARDPQVALANNWREQAQPIPEWALSVDRETPRWGIEICNHAWIQHLERMLWMIGNETALTSPSPATCGSVSAPRRQWASAAVEALSRWLSRKSPSPTDASPAPELYSLLGDPDQEKNGAVRFLRDSVILAMDDQGKDFEDAFADFKPESALAREMRDLIQRIQFKCNYRWDRFLLDLCRAIGDPAYRASNPPEFRVGSCGGQLAFVYRDDPLRVPTTSAFLVGAWAWLQDISPDAVASTYPALAPLAEHVRQSLGEVTPAKRWLAGRLFVGIRIWLQEIDHGDIEQPRPALDPYPTLL